MRRRTLLATAGTLLTAGCGGLQSGSRGSGGRGAHVDGLINNTNESEFDFSDAIEDRNFSMGDVNDVEFEFNESKFAADFESKAGGAREESGTPMETDPRATELMQEAMTGIQKAYEAYVSQAGSDATLMDVGITLDSFNALRVRRLAKEARTPLEEATEYAPEGQKQVVLALVQVTIFLEDLARVRRALIDAYDDFVYAVERLYAESTTRARYTVSSIREYRKSAKQMFRPLKREIDEGAMAVFTPVGSVYDDKIDQIEAELDGLRWGAEGVMEMAKALEKWPGAVEAYLDRDYERAVNRLDTAAFGFSYARSDFERIDQESGMTDLTGEIARVAGTLETTADALGRSASAKVEDDPQRKFFEAQRAAERAVNGDEIVSEMRTANRIIT
ncbi:hypothetical protein [Halorientalis halophila]|uniref:hypothetical protein n=1 Tax=Halorientalis halophila TaxID=3108499 RepID=UPI003008925C